MKSNRKIKIIIFVQSFAILKTRFDEKHPQISFNNEADEDFFFL